MGGYIRVIIRKPNREVLFMNRWTNPLPHFLDSISFHDEEEHLKEYVDHWYDMQEDYNKNKKTKKFKHNMTDVYFPTGRKYSKSEYGIVFVDYITKTIISYQEYTSIFEIGLPQISLAHSDTEFIDLIKHIISKGKLTCNKSYFVDDKEVKEVFIIKDYKEIENMIQQRKDYYKSYMSGSTESFTDYYISFIIDNSPWKLISGRRNDKALKDIRFDIEQILENS